MTNNLEIAKRIIKKHFNKAHSGICNRRTLFKVKTLYEKDGLEIDICYYNDGHFEVFGLSNIEFEELKKYYESLGEQI